VKSLVSGDMLNHTIDFCRIKVKGEILSVHAMKVYSGSRDILLTPLMLNLSTRWRSAVDFTYQLIYLWGKPLSTH
jgi:hypothetical protein